MEQPRVSITQPYVPRYRLPLLDRIISSLADKDVQARVFYASDTNAAGRARGDSEAPAWAEQVQGYSTATTLGVGTYRRLPDGWRRPDLLLTELAAGNGNAWASKFTRRPYVLIGHGKGYTNEESQASIRLEAEICKSARHVLTYVESGRREVIARTGLPTHRVSAFRNSTDTYELSRHVAAVTTQEVDQFRAEKHISPKARCALFIGALEAYKRIDLLSEAAEIVFRQDPEVHLIVGGDGPERAVIEQLCSKYVRRVTWLGRIETADVALAGRVSSFVVCPGRVGLLAVDSLALGLPLLTTNYRYHGPEIEYLASDRSLVVVAEDADELAGAWLQMKTSARRPSMRPPTIGDAASHIADVVLRQLGRA